MKIPRKREFLSQICPQMPCSPIKAISIVSDEDVWLRLQDVLQELAQETCLVLFIEHREWTLAVWLKGVLKVLNIGTNHLPVGDQEAL